MAGDQQSSEHERCVHPGCLRTATRKLWTTQGNGSALLPFCEQHPNARERGPGKRLSDRA